MSRISGVWPPGVNEAQVKFGRGRPDDSGDLKSGVSTCVVLGQGRCDGVRTTRRRRIVRTEWGS